MKVQRHSKPFLVLCGEGFWVRPLSQISVRDHFHLPCILAFQLEVLFCCLLSWKLYILQISFPHQGTLRMITRFSWSINRNTGFYFTVWTLICGSFSELLLHFRLSRSNFCELVHLDCCHLLQVLSCEHESASVIDGVALQLQVRILVNYISPVGFLHIWCSPRTEKSSCLLEKKQLIN